MWCIILSLYSSDTLQLYLYIVTLSLYVSFHFICLIALISETMLYFFLSVSDIFNLIYLWYFHIMKWLQDSLCKPYIYSMHSCMNTYSNNFAMFYFYLCVDRHQSYLYMLAIVTDAMMIMMADVFTRLSFYLHRR